MPTVATASLIGGIGGLIVVIFVPLLDKIRAGYYGRLKGRAEQNEGRGGIADCLFSTIVGCVKAGNALGVGRRHDVPRQRP